MAIITAPYFIPLFLGMTFDAHYSKPGVDIFEPKWVDDPAITYFDQSEAKYIITQKKSDIQKALGIDGDIALKIKTGVLDITGKGTYIKNDVDFLNRIEIFTTLKYISKTKYFKEGATPVSNWVTQYNPSVLGTHYVSSITYGAELIASLGFVVFNSNHTSEIRALIEGKLGTAGSGDTLVAEGQLEELQKSVAGKANLEISYYGTVPLNSTANTIKDLRYLVRNFKDSYKEDFPMSVGLTPLTEICDEEHKDKFEFLKNKNLEDELQEFEEQFDELRSARSDLISWSKALPYNLDAEIEQKIGRLMKNISQVLEVYYNTVWKLDLTQGPQQLDGAKETYNYDGYPVRRRYERKVMELKVILTPFIKWDDVASDSYVQWGNDNCTATGTVVLYKGFTATSAEEGIGGPASYTCIPQSFTKGYDLDEDGIRSKLAGVRYTSLGKDSNPFIGHNARKVPGKGIPCAKCFSIDSASVAIFSALDTCPLTWEKMYQGFLMSSRQQEGHTTEFICVDESPSQPVKMENQPSSRDTAALTVVNSAGSLPKGTYPDKALIKCIVCSMKVNQVVI